MIKIKRLTMKCETKQQKNKKIKNQKKDKNKCFAK